MSKPDLTRSAGPAGRARQHLSWGGAVGWAAGAVVAFHLAFAGLGLHPLILIYLYCLLRLAELRTWVRAVWIGLAVGLLVVVPQLYFFYPIFGTLTVALWLLAGGWQAAFVILARAAYGRLGGTGRAVMAPVMWTGLEYFRGELYSLKFTWLSFGYAFAEAPSLAWLGGWGLYGLGFAGMAVVAGISLLPRRAGVAALVVSVGGLFALDHLPEAEPDSTPSRILAVAGVQLEFPDTALVRASLDRLVQEHPDADILVLSEMTFSGPVPQAIKAWCREHKKYLIAGGTDPLPDGTNFYNTAFVIGPDGAEVFRQAKSVPVQFFADGLPAREQRVWESPWGKIGLGICYDAGFRRVGDELVRLGAQALIFPTMDEADWGAQEHHLASLVAPMRAAEYAVPLFRLCSSGISLAVERDGSVMARAAYPGPGEMIYAEFTLPSQGRVPWDHWVAPVCTGMTGLVAIGLAWASISDRLKRRRSRTLA